MKVFTMIVGFILPASPNELLEMYRFEIILGLVVMFVSIVISTIIGARKGNTIAGFLIGLFLGPIGVIIALVSGDKNRIPCKFCAEKIQKTAVICPHCNKELSA